MATKKKHNTGAKSKGNGKIPSPDPVAVKAGPQPVPKSGPNFYLRARSRKQIESIKQAAYKTGYSMNTWVMEVLDRAVAAAGIKA